MGKLNWTGLRHHFRFLTAAEDVKEPLASQDVCDAVVCALAARARSMGVTLRPRDDEEFAAARREGWIHVSVADPCPLLG